MLGCVGATITLFVFSAVCMCAHLCVCRQQKGSFSATPTYTHTLYITPQGQRPDQHVPRIYRIILSQIFPQRYGTWIAAIEELKDNNSLFSRLTPSPELIDRLFLVESLRTCLSKLARSSTQFVLLSCWIWNCVLHKAILFYFQLLNVE